MIVVLLVEKSGQITETKLKTFSIEEICKKAKVKSVEDYKRKHVWTVNIESITYHIALYARTTGRAGQENKYDFPPPVDSELYFGNCMLVNQTTPTDTNEVQDLSKEKWFAIYEKLFGGFDDCMDSEDESEDDIEGLELTKDGYEIDDFVVEDDDYDEEDDYETEEEIVEEPPTKRKSSRKKTKETKQDEYLGCDSELEEEEYFA